VNEPSNLPASHGRSLAGFYVVVAVVALLVAASTVLWRPLHAAYRERAVTRDFLLHLDKRVRVDFKDVPAAEALDFAERASDVSMIMDLPPPETKPRPVPNVTLQRDNVPVGAVLDFCCRQLGLDWTIAPLDSASRRLQVVIADPQRIAELERASPWTSGLVRQYRKELAAQEPLK
jgi:hypothetical protein